MAGGASCPPLVSSPTEPDSVEIAHTAASLGSPQPENKPPIRHADTSRHSVECLCEYCEANQTGRWASQDVLAAHNTDEITPELYAQIVALCESRGRVRRATDAA